MKKIYICCKINIMIDRKIERQILKDFQKKKVLVILGARQVGKTTLLSQIDQVGKKVLSLNCDNADDRLLLENRTTTELSQLLSSYDLAFIDEAQRVANIGITIKMIGDLKLDTQVIVTGSSSFDIANRVNEPATGRTIEYNLYPFSMRELADYSSQREEHRLLGNRLIYGMYPEVVMDPADAKRTLVSLANNYLYKDLLSYKGIKKPELLQNLVKALALQVGSEVSYNELGNMLGVDKETVENYIDLLEKCFVVFRLSSFSRNMRNEIKKGKKIYFYDNGIRNAVISNFAPIEMRTDVGALWENFMISERVKRNSYIGSYAQLYFWRTHDQSEVDLIEEEDGVLHTFEFKWNPRRKGKLSQAFSKAYPNSTFQLVSPDNYWEFIG